MVMVTSSGEVLGLFLEHLREVFNLPVLGATTALPLQAAELWGEAVLTCSLVRPEGALCFLAVVCECSAGCGAAAEQPRVLILSLLCRSSAAPPKHSLNFCAPSPPSPIWKGHCPRIPAASLGWYQIWSSWMWMTGNSRKIGTTLRSFLDIVIYWSCS